MRKKTLVVPILAATWLLAAGASLAAEIEPCTAAYDQALKAGPAPGAPQVWTLIESERQSGCILGATDSTGIRQLYLDLQSAPATAEVAVKRAQLFSRVLDEFKGFPTGSCPGDSTVCMVGRHVQAISDVRQLLNVGNPNHTDPLLQNSEWTAVVANGRIGVSQIALQPYLSKECQSGVDTPQCRAAVDLSAKILRSSEAVFQAIVAHRKPIIEANELFLTTRDQEWDAYFNDIAVQYPWELAINSARFVKKNPNPAERGQFPRAPSAKLIALHPVAGFEYAEVAGEHSTQAAVLVELIGYERWRWREGKATNRVGASLAASFADVPGSDPVGYGVVLHLPFRNISVGAIWRDGDAGDSINIVVNVDLAKLIEQYKDADVTDFLKVP